MRKKSKNLHGKFSGDMKSFLAKIKEGAALLVVRSEAVGDPQFLRMRNTELTTRLREVEKENGWLKEQARKTSPGADSPLRKRKVEKRVLATTSADVENTVALREMTPTNAEREEFPPLPQRTPRNKIGETVAQRLRLRRSRYIQTRRTQRLSISILCLSYAANKPAYCRT